MDGRIITIGGKRWRLRYVDMRNDYGECDPPDKPHKEIRIAKRLKKNPVELAETLAHETLHAFSWQLDEGAVEQAAVDIARILDQEGLIVEDLDG
jgi:hypothetical protein